MAGLLDDLFLNAYLTAEQQLLAEASFNRPADTIAYTAPTSAATGDFIGQSAATIGLCIPLQFNVAPITAADSVARGKIAWVRLRDAGSAAAKSIRVHFLKGAAAPTVTSLDNAAITFGALVAGQYLGFADVALQPSPRGGSYGSSDLIRIPYELDMTAPERLWTYHEALTAFVPGNASQFLEVIALDRTR